jgi:hypothetical protein
MLLREAPVNVYAQAHIAWVQLLHEHVSYVQIRVLVDVI